MKDNIIVRRCLAVFTEIKHSRIRAGRKLDLLCKRSDTSQDVKVCLALRNLQQS